MIPVKWGRVALRCFLPFLAVMALLVPATGRAQSLDHTARYVATYFLTNVRCPSCLRIEQLTEQTIKTEFARQLATGLLQWRTINIDGEGNYHYVKDYGLYTKSVIISEVSDEGEIRWKNLPRVWELLGNEEEFRKYLTQEINNFMAGP